MAGKDFTQMLPKDFDLLPEEELARACVRGSGDVRSEAEAMYALRRKIGIGVNDHRAACMALWSDRKSAAEILDAVRSMGNAGGLT